MDIIFKLCLISLAAIAAGLIMKDNKNPHGPMLLTIAVCLYILFSVLPYFSAITGYVRQMIDLTGINAGVFAPLAKVTVLAVCVKITAEICRDNGHRAVASKLEIAGAAVGIALVLPLVGMVIELIGGL